jgi:DNA polymerase-1
VLIDGHNLIYRCYYGVPPMARDDGVPTNAAFGFTQALMKMLGRYWAAEHFGTTRAGS